MNAPIFVVGTMRSGSTLLRLVLDSHPRIAIGEETGFMGALVATKAIPGWRYGREWYGRLGWTEEELDTRLRDFYSGMFARHAERQGKPRWGDKTPLHSWHIAEMAKVFPDAVFVGIVRHPGAVVASLKRRFHWDVAEAARYWESTNVEILRHAEALGDARLALLRYEDLVSSPEPTLRELIDWLGERWSDDVLRHADVQKAKGAPRLVDGSTSTRDTIDATRAGRWRNDLDEHERAVMDETTREVYRYFGYDREGSAPERLVPSESSQSLLLTGGMVKARQAESGYLTSLQPRKQVLAVPEIGTAELAARLQQAEASLARIRSRPVVRYADAVRRFQRRLPSPLAAVPAVRNWAAAWRSAHRGNSSRP